jgi:uncharacterized protein
MSSSRVKNEPLKVILDSNSLFVPLKFKIDIFNEVGRLLNRNVELVLLSPVKHELELLAKKDSSKMRKAAFFALKLAEKCKFIHVDVAESMIIDDVIVEVAAAWGVPVFTNDINLKKRLRDISVPVIYVRQKSRLDIDGLIS